MSEPANEGARPGPGTDVAAGADLLGRVRSKTLRVVRLSVGITYIPYVWLDSLPVHAGDYNSPPIILATSPTHLPLCLNMTSQFSVNYGSLCTSTSSPSFVPFTVNHFSFNAAIFLPFSPCSGERDPPFPVK